MLKKTITDLLAETDDEVWDRVVKEMTWAYRLGKPKSVTLALVTGGTGHVPSRENWDLLRAQVKKLRRNARNRAITAKRLKAAEHHREYMRLYMKRRRKAGKQ